MGIEWSDELNVSIYWGVRSEAPSDVAAQVRRFASFLSSIDEKFSSLEGLRSSADYLLDVEFQFAVENEPERLEELAALLRQHEYLLRDVDDDLLADELTANDGRECSLTLWIPDSKISMTLRSGRTNLQLLPAVNHVRLKFPIGSSPAGDPVLLARCLDSMIEIWRPVAGGVMSQWSKPRSGPQNHPLLVGAPEWRWAFWLHWRELGLSRMDWKDVRGNQVASRWPTGVPETSRPHLGGMLDTYPQHHPELLTYYAMQGRPPS